MEENSFVSMALYLKTFMSRVGSCVFQKATGTVDNKINFNSNLDD